MVMCRTTELELLFYEALKNDEIIFEAPYRFRIAADLHCPQL